MTAAFLPPNPSKSYGSNLSRPRILHKSIIRSQNPHPHTYAHTNGLRVSRCDSDERSPKIVLGNYEQELQQRIKVVQDAHSVWYNAIASNAQEQNAIRQERLSHAKHERDRIVEAERQEHERIERSQLEARRRRIAEEAERRRIEDERLQREWDEAQAARLVQIAAEEEERRRQAEQAERIQRERLRECTVCFDSQDMDMMVQVACSHWYCRQDLRSRHAPCGSSDQS